MAVKTLSYKSSILALLAQPSYTRCRLLAHALTAVYAPLFEARRDEGMQVLIEEIGHNEARIAAQARVAVAMAALNRAAVKVGKEILLLTDNDTSSALYRVYFRDDTLSDFKRARRGVRIARVLTWVESLQQSGIPSLQALAPEVLAAATEADAAVTQLTQAHQRMRDFRNVGVRRQWVDRLNATRKETYGVLAKLPHEHLELPSDFARQFFLSEPDREEKEDEDEAGDDEAEETEEGLLSRIEALQQELAATQARLAELFAARAAAKIEAEARAAREAELAELDRAVLKLEERRAALRAGLEPRAA